MHVERGAAWRRRQRRLRSWWRHEQQQVAAVLATVTHHSHFKVGTANDAPRSQKKVTSTEVGPAEYYKLSSDDGRPTGEEERPEALLEPWPQGKLLRHAGVGYEIVQSPDVPALQMVEQNSTAFYFEQTVDIPVPRSGGLQGSRPGQGSSASSSRSGVADETGQDVFRTFPLWKKSAGLGPHSGSELGADFTPWTPAAYAESMAGADDEFEAEAEVEEDAATRFAAGFRPMRVCTRFLEDQLGRPVWGCAYDDRCTFAHSWAELHPEASAHEHQLASYFPD